MFHYFPFSVQTDLAAALVVHENVPLVRGMRAPWSIRCEGEEGRGKTGSRAEDSFREGGGGLEGRLYMSSAAAAEPREERCSETLDESQSKPRLNPSPDTAQVS